MKNRHGERREKWQAQLKKERGAWFRDDSRVVAKKEEAGDGKTTELEGERRA